MTDTRDERAASVSLGGSVPLPLADNDVDKFNRASISGEYLPDDVSVGGSGDSFLLLTQVG